MESEALTSLLMTVIAPTIVMLIYWLQLPRGREVGGLGLGGALGAGVLSLVLVLLLGMPFAWVDAALQDSWLGAFVEAFISAALLEEASKGLLLRYVAGRDGRTRLGGMFLGLVVGLTFGLIESVSYSLTTADETISSAQIAYMRAFLATPMHGLATGLFGYFLAAAPGRGLPRRAWRPLARGLALAIALHGLYDVVQMVPLDGALNALTVPIMIAGVCTFQWFWWRGAREDARVLAARQAQQALLAHQAAQPGSGRLPGQRARGTSPL